MTALLGAVSVLPVVAVAGLWLAAEMLRRAQP